MARAPSSDASTRAVSRSASDRAALVCTPTASESAFTCSDRMVPEHRALGRGAAGAGTGRGGEPRGRRAGGQGPADLPGQHGLLGGGDALTRRRRGVRGASRQRFPTGQTGPQLHECFRDGGRRVEIGIPGLADDAGDHFAQCDDEVVVSDGFRDGRTTLLAQSGQFSQLIFQRARQLRVELRKCGVVPDRGGFVVDRGGLRGSAVVDHLVVDETAELGNPLHDRHLVPHRAERARLGELGLHAAAGQQERDQHGQQQHDGDLGAQPPGAGIPGGGTTGWGFVFFHRWRGSIRTGGPRTISGCFSRIIQVRDVTLRAVVLSRNASRFPRTHQLHRVNFDSTSFYPCGG